jgi:quercetin dioxygenase-like cupin family protein
MKFPRIYSDENGETHISVRDLAEHDAPLGPPPNPVGRMSDREAVNSFVTFSVPAGAEAPAHNAPQPYICIVLSGEGEVVASDGATVRLGPGGLIYCDDVRGKGHVTRSITELSLAFVNRSSA